MKPFVINEIYGVTVLEVVQLEVLREPKDSASFRLELLRIRGCELVKCFKLSLFSLPLLTGPLYFSALYSSTTSPLSATTITWTDDNRHCTAYILRHLRKFLVLCAGPHNPDAVRAGMHLAALPQPDAPEGYLPYDPTVLRRLHDDEHGNVGLGVRLSLEDLERLHVLLQPTASTIEDPPVSLGELVWNALFSSPVHPTATIVLGDVEQELRRHLELDLALCELEQRQNDGKGSSSIPDDEEESTLQALARLKLSHKQQQLDDNKKDWKEITYAHLRSTTILLKQQHASGPPAPATTAPETASSGASLASNGEGSTPLFHSSPGRLHDLMVSDCSDAHCYLCQPFEHATILGCSNCTIVVGAVAGLVHIVDCEKATISVCARRILVSNCVDVQICLFSPSPPLLVGDNRGCQFAPYNTYYDGLRDDLLASGLAAAAVPEGYTTSNQSPSVTGSTTSRPPHLEEAWPPLHSSSNKWKNPIELSKLEVPATMAPGSPGGSLGSSSTSPTSTTTTSSSAPGDDIMSRNDTPMHTPILLPASEFHILFVPINSELTANMTTRGRSSSRHLDTTATIEDMASPETSKTTSPPADSHYCRYLSELLHLSPFRLPVEYERRVLLKVERMRTLQQRAKTLTPEQQTLFETELNDGFRDWLVSSGNLRQVLDLVQLEQQHARQ